MALVPLTVSLASAASLDLAGGDKLAAAATGVSHCDSGAIYVSSFNVTYSNTNARYEVSSVMLSNIDASCNGATVNVSLTDSSDNSVGSGSATVSSTTATVSIAATSASSSVSKTKIVVVGP